LPAIVGLAKETAGMPQPIPSGRWPVEVERYKAHGNQSSEGGRVTVGTWIPGVPLS